MSEPELKPCPCCGSENVAFYTGLPDGYIVACKECHAGLKHGLKTKEQAAATWNAAQVGAVEDVSEKEAESSSWAELIDLLIDRLFVKIKAVATVSQSAKYQCGNSHVAAACDYLTSEAAVMQDLLYDIKREIEKRSKNDRTQ